MDRTVERQLAEQHPVGDLAALDHALRRQDAERDRQIEGRARLPHVGGREIHRDAMGGKLEAGIADRARTRSRLSRTLASGRPTIVKQGKPNDTSTSTWTGQASMPKTAAVRRLASMASVRCKARGRRPDPLFSSSWRESRPARARRFCDVTCADAGRNCQAGGLTDIGVDADILTALSFSSSARLERSARRQR